MTAAHDTTTTIAEFFPTPTNVIRQLIAPITDRLGTSMILEPSAGKGDILDYLVEYHGIAKGNVYAIEANPELQFVLAGKGYRVLESDFLAFNEPYSFNLIIMNPPFSKGVDHLLKAWDVVAPGGAVCCLLNAETLRNPHTEKRRLLARLVAEHGYARALGQAFTGAPRPTDVSVSVVVLNKPETERLGVLDDATFDTDAPEREAAFDAAPLARRNMIQSLVDQYNAAVALVKQRDDINQRLAFYLKSVADESLYKQDKAPSLNDQLAEIKDTFWSYIFRRTRLGSAATSKFVGEFDQMRQQNASMAFTVDNITAVLELLMTNYNDIIKRCIVDVFDQITQFHEKNKVHTEGWKTNKSWRINRKIIVPWGVEYNKWGWSFAHYKREFYTDLDKACCFLAGTDYETLRRRYHVGVPGVDGPARTIEDAISDHIHGKTTAAWDDKFESEFFSIRVYKKGTVHLVFKDEALWARFNQAAAEGKAWMGPGY